MLTQPFRLLAKARSHLPFQRRYNRLDLKLQFTITTNLYMLPERELASPQAMTEGCHKKKKEPPRITITLFSETLKM